MERRCHFSLKRLVEREKNEGKARVAMAMGTSLLSCLTGSCKPAQSSGRPIWHEGSKVSGAQQFCLHGFSLRTLDVLGALPRCPWRVQGSRSAVVRLAANGWGMPPFPKDLPGLRRTASSCRNAWEAKCLVWGQPQPVTTPFASR